VIGPHDELQANGGYLRVAKDLSVLKAKMRAASGKGPSRAKALREPVTSIAKVESDRSRKNSRTKGNRGELDVAQVFSKWSGELVRRTPGSGGWGGSKDFGTTADLVCNKKAFPFHVEVKHREGWVLDDLVTGIRSDHDKSIVKWWEQCVESCPKTVTADETIFKKIPLLVFRRNRQPWLAMFPWRDEEMITWPSVFKLANCAVEQDLVIVTLLDELLGMVSVPKGLKNYR